MSPMSLPQALAPTHFYVETDGCLKIRVGFESKSANLLVGEDI